jgi:hypothetical protein
VSEQHFEDAASLLAFLLGGKAIFSVRSKSTGQHFTYRMKRPNREPNSDVKFVELRGSDGVFRYFGNIDPTGAFAFTRKTPAYMKDHPAVIGFNYLWRWLKERASIPDTVQVWHEGQCSVCGIRLTHPESIKLGIGPECAKKKGHRQ